MSVALWPVKQWRKLKEWDKLPSPSLVMSSNVQILAPPARGGRGLSSVLEVVLEAFPDDPSVTLAVEVCLSAAAALCLKQVEGCPAVLLEGPASGRKTTVLRFFPQELKDIVYRTDKFTPASFVTNISGKSQAELEKIDLLPRIAHKVFVVPEMRVIFSDRQEKLQENLGVLTRVLDGQGYSTDTGVYGQRKHEGDLKFCFLGATTPLSEFAWQEMSNVGSRMLVLDMGGRETSAEELAAMLTEPVGFEDKVKGCRDAVGELLSGLWERSGGYGGVVWDTQSQSEKVIANQVGRLAKMTSRLRGQVDRGEKKAGAERNIQLEAPTRLATVLMNIARGHAILAGRTELTEDDVRVVRHLALYQFRL